MVLLGNNEGERDEGILVITAYRICQEASDNPGPLMAYAWEYTAMQEAGIKKPNPRRQILHDIKTPIEEKRRDGYRPIVMMDANGDEYMKEKGGDADLRDFVKTAGLADPYLDRFSDQIRTYMYGKRRLDYIFMDSALVQAVS